MLLVAASYAAWRRYGWWAVATLWAAAVAVVSLVAHLADRVRPSHGAPFTGSDAHRAQLEAIEAQRAEGEALQEQAAEQAVQTEQRADDLAQAHVDGRLSEWMTEQSRGPSDG